MLRSTRFPLFVLIAALTIFAGCAAPTKPLNPKMESMAVQHASDSKPAKLEDNHFRTDRTGNLTEDQLKEILEAPIFLEEETRVGVVPVATAYQVDKDIPVNDVPHKLGNALEDTGFFEVATEVATDWQRDRGIAGLRELAARYRVNYLLLYRHRFEQRSRTNAWGWTMPTLVGALATPHRTVEMAGVMEATLFDVRTGTIMFTAYERVQEQDTMSIWHAKHKHREMKAELLDQATGDLQKEVADKVRRLVAARPDSSSSSGHARGESTDAPEGSVRRMDSTSR